jgi:hypothetical protein
VLPTVAAPEAARVLAVSSAAGQGLDELKEFLWKFVAEARMVEDQTQSPEPEWPEV